MEVRILRDYLTGRKTCTGERRNISIYHLTHLISVFSYRLMLIAASSLVGEDMDGSCHVQLEVYDRSVKLNQERGGEMDAYLKHLGYLIL